MTDASTPTVTSIPPVAPAVAVFGLDQKGRAHGASFGCDDADRARQAARLAGLHALELDAPNEPLRELVGKLPAGRIFPSGACFTPFVARALLDGLCAAGGVTADDLARLRASSAASKPATGSAAAPARHSLPADRGAIVVGSIVLAGESGDAFQEPWYAAIATDVEGDSLRLRWRDWPNEPEFFRHRDNVALLPPKAPGEG